jgi:hypothetical protein
MKAQVTMSVDGCEAASHEFDLDRIEILGGTAVSGEHQMVLRVDRTAGGDPNQIVIFGGTQTGTDRNMVLVWRAPDGTDNGRPIFEGTPTGTNNGKMLKGNRVEIVVDWCWRRE